MIRPGQPQLFGIYANFESLSRRPRRPVRGARLDTSSLPPPNMEIREQRFLPADALARRTRRRRRAPPHCRGAGRCDQGATVGELTRSRREIVIVRSGPATAPRSATCTHAPSARAALPALPTACARARREFSPFCRVCLIDGRLVAAVRFTPILIGGKSKALLLGPLAVDPAFANRGYGRGLVATALRGRARLPESPWSCWWAMSPTTATRLPPHSVRADHAARPRRPQPAAGGRTYAGRAPGLFRRGCRGADFGLSPANQSWNGSRIRIVSSRSGLVDSSVTGHSISSSMWRTYFTACAGSSAQLRAPRVDCVQPSKLS